MAEKKRPGVMLYFDVRPCLKRLSLEEKGRLFEGILDYAQYGVIPEFEGMLGVAWDFIQPRIDRDEERYGEVSESRRRAAMKRWEGQDKESGQSNANACFAVQTMPTTTPTTTPITTTTPTPASASTEAKRRKTEEMAFEDLRREKVRMISGLIGGG